MIDITKTYKTKNGHRVINLHYVPLNSVGDKVTYPIKGTVILNESPYKTTYQIWAEDGSFDVVKRANPYHNWDLVLDEK